MRNKEKKKITQHTFTCIYLYLYTYWRPHRERSDFNFIRTESIGFITFAFISTYLPYTLIHRQKRCIYCITNRLYIQARLSDVNSFNTCAILMLYLCASRVGAQSKIHCTKSDGNAQSQFQFSVHMKIYTKRVLNIKLFQTYGEEFYQEKKSSARDLRALLLLLLLLFCSYFILIFFFPFIWILPWCTTQKVVNFYIENVERAAAEENCSLPEVIQMWFCKCFGVQYMPYWPAV